METELVCGEENSKNSNPGLPGSVVHVPFTAQVPSFLNFDSAGQSQAECGKNLCQPQSGAASLKSGCLS